MVFLYLRSREIASRSFIPIVAISGWVWMMRGISEEVKVVLFLWRRFSHKVLASRTARSVEESLLPIQSPIAKMFLTVVLKNLSTMMPVRL